MANIVYIASSLDGFVAKEDGSIDWLADIPNEKQSDYGFSQFLLGIDAIVMGRNTFETALGFSSWPYSKPVFVLSRTMKSVPAAVRTKAEIVSGPIKDVIAVLEKRNMRNIYVDGGKTIQSFLKEDLVDEMIVTTVSKVLGGGIPLFGSIGRELQYKVQETEILNDYLVKTKYVRI